MTQSAQSRKLREKQKTQKTKPKTGKAADAVKIPVPKRKDVEADLMKLSKGRMPESSQGH